MRRALFALAMLLVSSVARANGAFPDSLSILLPAGDPQQITLATNFGLVFTRTMFPSTRAAHLPPLPAAAAAAARLRLPADWTVPTISAASYEIGLDSDIKHDATDCRTAFEQGRLHLRQ